MNADTANADLKVVGIASEQQEDATPGIAAFAGVVASATRDSFGNITQLGLFVREERPDLSSTVPLGSAAAINAPSSGILTSLSGAALFTFSPNGFIFSKFLYLTFARSLSLLQPGAEIIVHAQPHPGSPALDAISIYTTRQSVSGQFVAKTTAAGFTLNPCSRFLMGQSVAVTVLPFNGTTFVGVNGLDGLTPGAKVVASGLLSFQSSDPASAAPMLTADEVRLLP